MITAFFLVGSLAFWALLGCSLILSLILTGTDHNWGAAVVVVATVAATVLLGDFHPITFVVENWAWLLMGFVAYFVAGAGWSIFKWWSLVKERAERFVVWKKEWLANYPHNDGLRKDAEKDPVKAFASRWASEPYFQREHGMPEAHEHKALLSAWILWWVFSLLNYVFFDFIRKLVKQIYLALLNHYRAIARKAFAGLVPEAETK